MLNHCFGPNVYHDLSLPVLNDLSWKIIKNIMSGNVLHFKFIANHFYP